MTQKSGRKSSQVPIKEAHHRDTNESVIKQLARQCRAAYIAARTQFENNNNNLPGEYRPPKKWDGDSSKKGEYGFPVDSVWPKMARYMLANGFDPSFCINVAFAHRSSTRYAVMPNQIMSPRTEEICREQLAAQRDNAEVEFQSQVCVFRSYVNAIVADLYDSDQQRWTACLLDENLSLSPLFRYCVAQNFDQKYVLTKYRDSAIMQYIAMPEVYDRIWKKWIPKELKESAALLMASAGVDGK